VHRFGDKTSFLIGCSTYTIQVGVMILPALRSEFDWLKEVTWLYNFIYVILLVAAVLNGWGASLLYIS
jgi:hypothetical protein